MKVFKSKLTSICILTVFIASLAACGEVKQTPSNLDDVPSNEALSATTVNDVGLKHNELLKCLVSSSSSDELSRLKECNFEDAEGVLKAAETSRDFTWSEGVSLAVEKSVFSEEASKLLDQVTTTVL